MAKIYGNTTATPMNPDMFGSGGSIVVDQEYNPTSTNAQSGKAVAEALMVSLPQISSVYDPNSDYAMSGQAVAEAVEPMGKLYTDYMLTTSDNLLDNTASPKKFIFKEDCTFCKNQGGALDFILKAQAGTVLYATFEQRAMSNTQLRKYEFIGSVTTQRGGIPPFKYSRNIIVEYDTGTGELTIREPKMDKFGDVIETDISTPYGKAVVTDYELMIGSKQGACFVSEMSGKAGIYQYPYDGSLATLQLYTPEGDNAPYCAANKLYVDTKLGSVEAALDSIIAIQNQLIGGGE